MKPTLVEFMRGKVYNSYIDYPGFESLYVRKGIHHIKGQAIYTFDIANVVAEKPGEGAFGKLIVDILERYDNIPIYVECVHNPRFGPKLIRMGFELCDSVNNCYILNWDGKFPIKYRPRIRL